MLTHEEKLNLVLSLIATGCTDPDTIIHCINKVDSDLFNKIKDSPLSNGSHALGRE